MGVTYQKRLRMRAKPPGTSSLQVSGDIRVLTLPSIKRGFTLWSQPGRGAERHPMRRMTLACGGHLVLLEGFSIEGEIG